MVKKVFPITLKTLFVTIIFLLSFSFSPVILSQDNQISIFELEVPELEITSTTKSELTIPSTKTKQLVIHILKPQADNIDYGQIFPFVNGEAAAPISQIGADEKGKVVRINLTQRPGYELVSGRNSIEIKAVNRRGRNFYASFALRTVTENRNQDFVYSTELGNNTKQPIAPELFLLEPESRIELTSNQKKIIKVSGVATAVDSIQRVTVNGVAATLKRGQEVTLRSFGLANEGNRVAFETTSTIDGVTNIVVEAIDTSGNHTKLEIPIIKTQTKLTSEFQGRKYALIVGISDFRYNDAGIPDLKYADADAKSVYEFLISPAGGKFSKENIILLTNSEATLSQFHQALTTLLNKVTLNDLLVIFLASHGGPDQFAPQNLYFAFHDTQLDKMADTALPMKDLQLQLFDNKIRRLVLIVDTCHSAGLTIAPGTRAFGINLVNLYTEKLLYKEEGRAFITSSDVNETSKESSQWGGGHGVFSHYLLEGLKGKADNNLDNLITVGELFRFVRQKVRFDTQFRQNPRLLLGTNENITLSSVNVGRK